MKTIPKANRQIVDEASEWFVEFRVGDVDQQARERFDEWVRRSPEHIRAYIEIARTYVEMPNPHGTKPLDVEALIAYARTGENIVPFDTAGSASPHQPRALAETKTLEQQARRVTHARPVPRSWLTIAASVLIAALAGAAWWQSVRYPLYNTDIGERRSITLADGSTVDLNARSRLRVEFTENERRVSLLEGQALFQVSKDKNRPFIVRSGSATVRAVGTQFDVNRKASGTTVTVLEGRVAVYSSTHIEPTTTAATTQPTAVLPHASAQSPAAGHSPVAPLSSGHPAGSPPSLPAAPAGLTDPSGSAAIFLSAGEQVTVTPATVVPAPVHADIGATTAWMERRLIFEGSKLSDVVQEFNRYNKRQLVIEGAQLSDFHVSGVYSSSDPASLIRFLREQPGMQVTETDNEVRIAAK
jgi:transmembrane sensor